MKAQDKYRFSLQWGADTAEKIQTGDLLGSLGNKKSEFVVAAVSEYLLNHPEILSDGRRLQLVVKANYTKEQLMAMIREAIAAHDIEVGAAPQSGSQLEEGPDAAIPDSYVDEMIRNLGLF